MDQEMDAVDKLRSPLQSVWTGNNSQHGNDDFGIAKSRCWRREHCSELLPMNLDQSTWGYYKDMLLLPHLHLLFRKRDTQRVESVSCGHKLQCGSQNSVRTGWQTNSLIHWCNLVPIYSIHPYNKHLRYGLIEKTEAKVEHSSDDGAVTGG